jgi:tyrosine-protein phosphatase OCA6
MTCIVPPFRFSTVEDGIYRGAYPTLKNFRFLKRLRLKMMISMVPEELTKDLDEFCTLEHIENVHFSVEKFTSDVTVNSAMMKSIIEILINTDHHPLYVHCLDGSHVTGLVVMCLRKLQFWKNSCTIAEFCRYMQDSSIEKEETSFFKEFAEEIVVGTKIPKWLWQGDRITRHPSMKLKLDPPPQSKPDMEHKHRQRDRGLSEHVLDEQLEHAPIITTLPHLQADAQYGTASYGTCRSKFCALLTTLTPYSNICRVHRSGSALGVADDGRRRGRRVRLFAHVAGTGPHQLQLNYFR